jgi:hypothetical protein
VCCEASGEAMELDHRRALHRPLLLLQ